MHRRAFQLHSINIFGRRFADINQRYTFGGSGLLSQDIRVCSKPSLPPAIFSRQFPVEVHFVTDNSVNGSGFSIQYKLGKSGISNTNKHVMQLSINKVRQ